MLYAAKYINPNNGKKKIKQLSLTGEFIKEWESTAEAVKILGFSSSGICACCLGRRKSHKNFIWKFS